MVRRAFEMFLAVGAFAAPAFAEISPPPTVPTIHAVEWTVGPGIFGGPQAARPVLVLGLAVPVARVGTESELFVGLESGIAPEWSPFVATVPILANGYVRMRLSDASGLRFGLATGALFAFGGGGTSVTFAALGTPAFDLHFTKHTRIVFEPALGLGVSSSRTDFLYYPRVVLGMSL